MPRILLIEDDDLVRKSILSILKRRSYEVFVFESGEEAINFLESKEIDMVVCDMRMPRMNGMQTIKAIRVINEVKKRKPIKEIIITGYFEDSFNKEVDELKVAALIYKPFNVTDFLNIIEKQTS